MKKLAVFFSLIVIAAQLVACGDQKKAVVGSRVGQGGGRGIQNKGQVNPNAQVPNTPGQASSIWGTVMPQLGTIEENGKSYPNQNANDVSRLFLSTNWPWEIVGATTTQADPNWDSSVYGSAKPCVNGANCVVGMTLGSDNGSQHSPLTFAGGIKLNQASASGQRISILGNGITLVFWDSLTGTTANGEVLNPIPVFIGLDSSQSYIQGSNVTLVFADDVGSLVIKGSISGSNFIGNTMQFTNSMVYTGEGINLSGNLGSFNISASAAFSN